MNITKGILIAIGFAASAFAGDLRIVPPAPDSSDQIIAEMGGTWNDGCVPNEPSVSRTGDEIVITLTTRPGPCTSVVSPWSQTVKLGSLPPALYTLSVNISHSVSPRTPWRTLQFPVTDADSPYSIVPNVGTVDGGTEVTIRGEFGTCPFAPPCINPQVLFGGVPASSVKEVIGGVVAVTPAHAAGVVDIELRGRAGTQVAVLPAAFTFGGPGHPDRAAWTPVLIPVLFNGPGAFGSQWITEAHSYNDSDAAITPLNRDGVSNCLPNISPCPTPLFAPKAWSPFFNDGPNPAGRLIWIPRTQTNALHFSLRVRDLSRESDGLGTEIQVVREDDLRDVIHIVNVPIGPGFRHNLRIYDLGFGNARQVTVFAYATDDTLLFVRSLTLDSPEEGCLGGPLGCVPNVPRFAALTDFSSLVPASRDRIRLEIQPSAFGMQLWAFVSVTNNATQQITTITPQ